MDSARRAANEDVGRTDEGVALINDGGYPFSCLEILSSIRCRRGKDKNNRRGSRKALLFAIKYWIESSA